MKILNIRSRLYWRCNLGGGVGRGLREYYIKNYIAAHWEIGRAIHVQEYNKNNNNNNQAKGGIHTPPSLHYSSIRQCSHVDAK